MEWICVTNDFDFLFQIPDFYCSLPTQRRKESFNRLIHYNKREMQNVACAVLFVDKQWGLWSFIIIIYHTSNSWLYTQLNKFAMLYYLHMWT